MSRNEVRSTIQTFASDHVRYALGPNAEVAWGNELQGCCILSGDILALAGGCRIFDDFSHRLGMRDHYDMRSSLDN
jgi:hypothetical protein